MSEPRYAVVTIAPKGKTMTVDLEEFHGQGCGAIMEAFDSMGTVTHEIHKPEYAENNHNGAGLTTGN
jgi:hypothetical protein